MKGNQHRLFIALPLSDGVRNNLQKVQEELGESLSGFRWLRPEGMHLTLRFIGEVGLEDVSDVCRLAEEAVEEVEPFGFELRGLGAFPAPQRPKVLWVGVSGEVDPLHTMAVRLEEAVRQLGLRPEPKPFRPHITIARAATGRSPGSGRGAQASVETLVEQWQRRQHGKVFVREVVTYRSNLRGDGPQYERLATAHLG